MKDGRDDATPGALNYPFADAPAPGSAVEVAPGVLWLRMPLPFALDHINLYAIADGAGWTLVDTGMQVDGAVPNWLATLSGALQGRPITRVICTHMHPDHIGMAGWLTRRFDCRLWTTRLEYLHCRVLTADTGREAPPDAVCFYRAAGWNDDAIEHYRARFGGFGKGIYMLPDSYRRVVDGETLRIGGRDWRAIIGRGHSPEHLCLHSPEAGLLISGDQVLPRISSNVSVHPMEPEADPLSEWLESLARIGERVGDDVLVLPSHNEPFRGLHARLKRLADGHAKMLTRLEAALGTPQSAVGLIPTLFRRTVDLDLLGLATGETLAHLNHLIARGIVRRAAGPDGVDLYGRAAA